MNLVQTNYASPVRAGYSFDMGDLVTYANNGMVAYDANGDPMFPADAADDNYNAFDVWPPVLARVGESGDVGLLRQLGLADAPGRADAAVRDAG